jgi:hypothetical protein
LDRAVKRKEVPDIETVKLVFQEGKRSIVLGGGIGR